MTGIYINGVLYDHIIDTLFSESNIVANPDWINQDAEVDTDIWSKKPLKIIYTLRVTDAEKWTLDQLLGDASAVTLVDTTYDLNVSVWVSSINATWEGDINWSKPWNIEITLTVIT